MMLLHISAADRTLILNIYQSISH